MKYFLAFLSVAVALGAASAGYIGGGGWNPGYSSVVYAPSYSGWGSGWSGLSGYGGLSRGWSGGWSGADAYGGGWNNGLSSGWW